MPAPQHRVLGLGGVFLRAKDPHALARWYRDHLGITLDGDEPFGMLVGSEGDMTVWSAFPDDTDYFGPGRQAVMVNYRVADLDAMLQQLRDAGADVDDNVEDFSYGRFGWASDPEGNRFELWEPQGPGF